MNNPIETDPFATSALAIENCFSSWWTHYVLRAHPVGKLNASEQHQVLLDAVLVIEKKGGVIMPLISDIALANLKTFKLIDGPGKVTLENEG